MKKLEIVKKLEIIKGVEELYRVFLVCVDGEPNAFKNREDGYNFIKSQGELFKPCKLSKDGLLFYHNDVDGYDTIEYFELENMTNEVYILSFYYEKGHVISNEKIFYADSYEKILDIAKEEINDDYEIIREDYKEYCDDLPDENSEELIEKYNKEFLDPKFAFEKLKNDGIFEMVEINGDYVGWKINRIDVN